MPFVLLLNDNVMEKEYVSVMGKTKRVEGFQLRVFYPYNGHSYIVSFDLNLFLDSYLFCILFLSFTFVVIYLFTDCCGV